MNAHVKPVQSARDGNAQIEWVLARARSMSAGLRLVQFEIDEIGISLKNGWITPEMAASNLAAIEQVPVMIASIFYRGGDE
jgi:hypothetical protein